MERLTKCVVSSASKELWNSPDKIKQGVSQLIDNNMDILRYLDIPIACHLAKTEQRCAGSANLSIENYKLFLECVAAHSYIAFILNLKPQYHSFMIATLYQPYSYVSRMSTYIRPTFQTGTYMSIYENLSAHPSILPHEAKFDIYSMYPGEAPIHKYCYGGGSLVHNLVRTFSPMMYNSLEPNRPFSCRHVIDFTASDSEAVRDDDGLWPSGGYLEPFYAAFKIVLKIERLGKK